MRLKRTLKNLNLIICQQAASIKSFINYYGFPVCLREEIPFKIFMPGG
jgi:hypothetical protein